MSSVMPMEIRKPTESVQLVVWDYRNGRRTYFGQRTLRGTTAAEFVANLERIAGGHPGAKEPKAKGRPAKAS